MAPRKYTLNEEFFSSIDTPEKAYWLGFLTADGCIREDIGTVTLHLKAEDAEHLDKLQEALNSNYPVETLLRDNSVCATLTVCSQRLVRDLVKLGLHANKTNTVQPWNAPTALLADYWRGVFDGDGCLTQQHRRGQNQWHLCFVSGSPHLGKAFHCFATTCAGSRSKLYSRAGRYETGIGGNRMVQRFVQFVYHRGPSLDRKVKLAQDVLLAPRVRNDWSKLTRDGLQALRAQSKSWQAVADALGTSRSCVSRLRQRLEL